MKRTTGLFSRIISRSTFSLAVQRAARGKRSRPEVRRFLENLDGEVRPIILALNRNSFSFDKYQQFPIRDPKTRMIHAPSFRDRVVHHAIMHATGPTFEKGAFVHSYACRKGKGQHAAIATAQQWTRNHDWFLKIDIAKFYDTVDHRHLRGLLARRFREVRLLALFDRLLDSYSTNPAKGLPIGALTSQYLGNFYLDPVDRWVKQTMRIRRYLRYMDDMLFFGGYAELLNVARNLDSCLEPMKLTIGNHLQLNRCELGVPFLGFTVYANRIRLNREGRKRLRRKVKELETGMMAGRISEGEAQQRCTSIFAHTQISDDLHWRRAVCRFTKYGES